MRTLPDDAATESIFAALPGLVLVADGHGRIVFANRALLAALQRPADDLIGRSWREVCASLHAADDPAGGAAAAALAALADGVPEPPSFTLPCPSLRPSDGEQRFIEWTVRAYPSDLDDRRGCTVWFGRDATAEQDSARARRHAERLLASVGNNMFDAQLLLSVEADGSYRIRAANRRYLETLRARGFTVNEADLIGKTRDDLVAELGIRPESQRLAQAHYRDAIRTQQPVRYETSFVLGQSLRHVETSVAPIVDERGICTHIVRTTRDLTEQMQSEQALRISEARLLQAQTVARIGSWEMRFPSQAVTWTDQIFRILELDPATERASYDRFLSVVHPDDRELLRRAFIASIEDRLPYHLVHRLLLPDGRIKWLDERSITEYAADGTPTRSIGTMQDITERMVAEQELGETRTAYRQLDAISRLKDRAIEASLNGIVFTDLEGRIGYVNRSFLRLWGFTSDVDVVGRPVWQLYVDQVGAAAAIQRLRLGEDWVGELVARRVNGTTFSVLLSATLIRDDRGEPVQLMASLVDVTARTQAKAELRRARDLLRTVVDSSPDGIFLKDVEHRFLLVNEAFAAIVGARPDEMVGRRDTDFWDARTVEGDAAAGVRGFRPDDLLALAGQVVRNDHVLMTRADGSPRIFSTVKQPLFDEQQRLYGVLGYTRDVTEQVEAAERQRRSLREKEILLREIHHRVKNNLQIVSSLLHFQAKNVRTPEDRAAFEDGRKRLLAMILVHDRLYQSEDLTSIEFSHYARSLVAALVATFEQDGRVQIRMETDDLRLPAELALPSGLILCELVTNVFKYAYPGAMSGAVDIRISRPAARVEIRVQDHGVGFPADFDPHAARTFGWHLIVTLLQQLAGEVETSNRDGACVRVSYPVPPERESTWNHPSVPSQRPTRRP